MPRLLHFFHTFNYLEKQEASIEQRQAEARSFTTNRGPKYSKKQKKFLAQHGKKSTQIGLTQNGSRERIKSRHRSA